MFVHVNLVNVKFCALLLSANQNFGIVKKSRALIYFLLGFFENAAYPLDG